LTHTLDAWGSRQAERHLVRLEEGIDLLGTNPSMGRECDQVRAGLRRLEIGSHVVLYLIATGGILVVRILHQQMLPAENL
jgi:toxin ParE1/3/4